MPARRAGRSAAAGAAGGRVAGGEISSSGLGFFLKQLFKIVTASHTKITAFPSPCRGNHVSTGRGRNWKGGNKELKKEEGPMEGEMPPPPPSSAGLFSLFGFLFDFKTSQ